jgi:hypothetical protein
LSEARVIALVVTAPAVADEVDDDVLVELLPKGESQPRYPDAGLGIVTVHVEDRRLIIRATSVQYIEERDSVGDVVKPTWLLTTM